MESEINSPTLLNGDYSLKNNNSLFFAGQITGVEGYMESASSGLMAGINCARFIKGKTTVVLPETSMIGALSRYISDETVTNFQPMGANMGVLPELLDRPRDKKLRAEAYANRGIEDLNKYIEELKLND